MVPGIVTIGIGGWWLLTLLRPDFVLGLGSMYRPGPYALAEAALLLVLLVAWYRWARRGASGGGRGWVLGWFTLFALAFAVLLPGGAYLFTWPALVGVAGLGAALRFTAPGSPVRTLAGCATAVPAMALVLPVALLLVPALGVALSAAPLLFAVLLVAAMAAVLEPLPRPRLLTAGMVVMALAAVTTIGISTAVDRYDASRPQPVSLAYAYEADTATAIWVSLGGPDQPQVGQLLTGGTVRLDDRVPPLAGDDLSTGPAPVAAALATPQADAPVTGEADGIRSIQVRIRVPADTYLVDVYADTTSHEIVGATVNGAALAGGSNRPNAIGDWRWGFRYAAPPADGLDLTLRERGSGPLRIRVVSTAPGLPGGVGAPTLRPDVELDRLASGAGADVRRANLPAVIPWFWVPAHRPPRTLDGLPGGRGGELLDVGPLVHRQPLGVGQDAQLQRFPGSGHGGRPGQAARGKGRSQASRSARCAVKARSEVRNARSA